MTTDCNLCQMDVPHMHPKKYKLDYFKPTGKWYTEETVEWPEDPDHYSKFAPLDKMRSQTRLRGMICVAIETPLGFPLMDNPHRDLLKNVDY